MTETKLKPAMDPEMWAQFLAGDNAYVRFGHSHGLIGIRCHGGQWDPWVASSLAAMCLHEQPFGFTREDVVRLRAMVKIPEGYNPFHDIADRIEALLPPEAV